MIQLANESPVAAADRVTPFCRHFGPCGGCQLQHLTYAAQLRDKAAQLRTLLQTSPHEKGPQHEVEGPAVSAATTLPELQLHPSPPLAYRNRIRLTLALSNDALRAGYLTPSSNSPTSGVSDVGFLPITECPIAAPILWRATEALLALLNQLRATWLSDVHLTPDQLELVTNADESRIQLSLYLRTKLKNPPAKLAAAFTALCEALRASVRELNGAGIFFLPPRSNDRSRRHELPRPGPTWGATGLMYSVEPRTSSLEPQTYWLPRGAFFQVNRFLIPELVALVTANRSGKLAWDLYAGVGLFSRALAAHFAHVTAVEIAEPAVTALASTKLRNLRAVKATTLDFLRAAVVERDRPDLIVLDPPRSGAGREVCELLIRVAAPTLVYVSCSPEILPGDLATLTAAGYTVTALHMVDLFPQTTHIETVAILQR